MTLKAYWRLDPAAEPDRAEPSARAETLARDVRPITINRYDHYVQIARAAALTAFDGLFIAHRQEADDSQIVAAAIARAAPRLRLVPEFPASVGSAVYAAKQAVTFQRAVHDRLGWAIAPDGDPDVRAAQADPVADADLGARIEEFLHVARGVHGERPFDFKGRFFEVQGGGFEAPLSGAAFPQVFLRGEQEDALARSARFADVHLFAPQPIEALRAKIEDLDRLALAAGRNIEFGISLGLAARESTEDLADLPETDIVGTYDDVAARLAELASAGIGHFVLSAAPSLEEAYRIGQFVLPRLRAHQPALRAAA
ncbi:LLM class flavin-dependent oxidoreductase [Sphingosinicella sp. BN140058]|uniref:LLM class flavin-dependent oxidoreductase n=1 Tax=Sphingosinicella sp. BN140058 TaxID=1892855 RepID=UPI0010124B81|nr:LLM class flavin-dependent oxidoreductase [Sphingosinicella sp. BN140058]QAY76052.1 LLM class flavin-dependent oxidoreductase [Sphingosinicella sp. BN140058]